MKRSLISIAFAIVTSFSLFSQGNIFNNPDNKAYFGLRVAGEVTCPGDVSSDGIGVSLFNNGGGIEFGGIYNIPIVANLYIEPGLKLYYNTYSVKDVWLKNAIENVEYDSSSIKKFGMRIPVMAGYRFDISSDIKLSIFTGPELEIGFSAKEKYKLNGVGLTENLYGSDGDMSRVDVLWGLGAGVAYRQYFFSISGAFGMVNMMKNSDSSFHENRLTFTLGYNF